jgi:hypothetical protein
MSISGNPDIDPLENDLNRPIRGSQEGMTPALERRKYCTVAIHHSAEYPIGAFQDGATAIELNGSRSLQHWVRVIPV